MKPASKQKWRLSRLTAALLAASAVLMPLQAGAATPNNPSIPPAVTTDNRQTTAKPRIQLAILLDTSNSMDGLIDQARNQLWQVVDEFSKARRGGQTATLEVAVYEYGNDSLSYDNGYIRKVTDLTTDLDRVSEALFSLTTHGGSEYCGYSIKVATDQLQWSHSNDDIKAIFIAGNEPFTQGPVAYKSAIAAANAVGIKVNTIHAGSYEDGVQTGWRDGALLAGGDYMSIDHNHKIAHIAAPQDQRIAELNSQLNQTYVPYGAEGKVGKERQLAQDANSSSISPALLAKRAKSKAGGLYGNSRWDLVDAIQKDKVKLESLDEAELPPEMAGMDQEQQKTYIAKQANERSRIKEEIADLSKAREQYVAEQKQKAAQEEVDTMDDALVSSIRKQGREKHFQFRKN